MNKPAIFLLAGALFAACSDDTAKIGVDVMPDGDKITTSAQHFNLSTRTVQVDSVLANTSKSQLGSIIDPEMRVRTTCDFLAQFHVPDNFILPKKELLYMEQPGVLKADSCVIRIYFDKYYGDSLATMKVQVRELDKARVMEEGVNYYTNLNPSDYVSTSASAINKSVAYAVKDLSLSDEQNSGGKYYRSISVRLPQDYGTQLMEHYYATPADFQNQWKFIHNVCPGFYFESKGGVGSMITADMMCLDVYFRYHTKTKEGNDTIVDGMQRMGATEEVIQNTRISNDYPGSLTADDLDNLSCTYLKTPTGLFTEATIPVSEIVAGEHYNDSINQTKIVFRRFNTSDHSSFNLPRTTYLLMVRKGDMKEFFEKDKLSDNITSYLTEYSSTNNVYQFSNVARLVAYLRDERDKGAGVVSGDNESQRNAKYASWEALHPDWNKVMIIPVNAEYATITTSFGVQKKLMRIQHNLSLTSTRIEGGKDNPVDISVIYSRYNR